MSRALSIADQMAIEARDLPKIAASQSTVSVYRQQDIASEIVTAINKAKGAAVIIVWDGCDRPEDTEQLKGNALRVTSRYNVQLFYAPVLKPGGTTIDEIAEELMTHFDNWYPVKQAVSRDVWMRFRGASLTPEEGWLLYELSFDIVIQFSNPT
jgi:hypothetical protein